MKYAYTGGAYTCFMGRMFAFGKPQDVTDRATLEAIGKRKDFKEVADEPEKVEAPAAPVLKRPILAARRK